MSDTSDITTLAVTIDGHDLRVAPGTTILTAAEGLQIDIPTFCYQKRLPVLASCRMCLVEIEGQGKLQPACATAVMDGMVVRTDTERVAETRSSMLDMLLANHPLDCPICDKGGECELQDMVMAYGPRESLFRDPKRVFHSKDIQLSPVVIMNVNRCIQCQRCVRICEEVVGAVALGTVDKGMDTAVTGFEGSLASCDQCGNCIEVCPVGALMSFPYRYKSRPWDLAETDTICPHCGTGCHLTVGTRDGEFMRVRSKWDTGLNLETLCVRGRFGMDGFASPDRIKRPMIRLEDRLVPVSWDEAGEYLRERVASLTGQAAGIVSPRLTNEVQFQFHRLMRAVFDSDLVATSTRFDIPETLGPLIRDFYTRAPLQEVIRADCTLVIGTNVTEENPVSEYLLRGAVREGETRLCLLSARPSRLDADAQAALRIPPGHEDTVLSALLAGLAAGEFDKDASGLQGVWNDPACQHAEAALGHVHSALSSAQSITLLIGTDLFRSPNAETSLSLIYNILHHLQSQGKKVALQGLFDRPNQLGSWDIATTSAQTLSDLLDRCANRQIGALYVAGGDPLLSCPDRPRVQAALEAVDLLIVQDAMLSDIAGSAHIVLPAAAHGEETGSFTNNEGRVQSVREFRVPMFDARPNLDIFQWLAALFDKPLAASPAEIFDEIADTIPAYSGLSAAGIDPDGTFTASTETHSTGPLDPPASSGAKATNGLHLITGNGLFHGGYLSEHSETLETVAPAAFVEMSTADAQARNLADGQTVQVASAKGKLTARLKVTPDFPEGLVFVPETYRNLRLNSLMTRGEYPCPVDLQAADR
ncbi:NADH-quinone oxidoreductase subunit NuoG [Ruegeria sp. HKCCD8929]|uniref:NADH-quinone oxidoreductase subunit NuoG n=1 Tax=Ruegeria sp. HKCCD8929 TaxID=2683006 RepID=UPI001C2B7CB5|nr:NADH-quinone oxidoreductase subunit NuoG [Ruegeria sp. HKCCD8929]